LRPFADTVTVTPGFFVDEVAWQTTTLGGEAAADDSGEPEEPSVRFAVFLVGESGSRSEWDRRASRACFATTT
jgi:hypothetical protein